MDPGTQRTPTAWLQSQYLTRQTRNPQYSIRAFAKLLKTSPGALSQFLSAKRKLTFAAVSQFANQLSLSAEEKRELFSYYFEEKREDRIPQIQLEADTFAIVSDWYHYGILALAKFPKNKATPHWVSKALGITLLEARQGLDRLTRLGLIRVTKGRMTRENKDLYHESAIPSQAIRKYHRQNLALAERAMDTVSLKERKFYSVTMAVDSRKLGDVQCCFKKFHKDLCQTLETGKPDCIYTVAIQLFPLTKTRKDKS